MPLSSPFIVYRKWGIQRRRPIALGVKQPVERFWLTGWDLKVWERRENTIKKCFDISTSLGGLLGQSRKLGSSASVFQVCCVQSWDKRTSGRLKTNCQCTVPITSIRTLSLTRAASSVRHVCACELLQLLGVSILYSCSTGYHNLSFRGLISPLFLVLVGAI
jgi:hypothetical protein